MKSRPPPRLAGYGSPRRLYGVSVFLSKRERCIRGSSPTAASSLGIASSKVRVSGSDLQSFNESDPVEVALFVGLRESAAAHVVSSTAIAYRGPWATFVN